MTPPVVRAPGIEPAYETCTLENWLPLGGQAPECLAWARRYVEELRRRRPRTGAVIAGPTGCGKTHLVAAIVNAAWPYVRGRLWSMPMLLDRLREHAAGERPYDPIVFARETPLLVLDDVGAERPTPFALERLYVLIAARLSRALPTIVTTNYARPTLLTARLGSDVGAQRIVSRLRETGPWFTLLGDDQRMSRDRRIPPRRTTPAPPAPEESGPFVPREKLTELYERLNLDMDRPRGRLSAEDEAARRAELRTQAEQLGVRRDG
jgi:hypothetical protein